MSLKHKIALMHVLGKNLPKDVERYVEEGKEQGMDESKAWAIAWSRYCQYKNPNSDHCKQDDYFPNRDKKASDYNVQLFPRGSGELNYFLSDGTMGSGDEEDIIAAIIKDTRMSKSDIKKTLRSGATIDISQKLFKSLRSWGRMERWASDKSDVISALVKSGVLTTSLTEEQALVGLKDMGQSLKPTLKGNGMVLLTKDIPSGFGTTVKSNAFAIFPNQNAVDNEALEIAKDLLLTSTDTLTELRFNHGKKSLEQVTEEVIAEETANLSFNDAVVYVGQVEQEYLDLLKKSEELAYFGEEVSKLFKGLKPTKGLPNPSDSSSKALKQMRKVLLKSSDIKSMDKVLWVISMYTEPTKPQDVADAIAIRDGALEFSKDLVSDFGKVIQEYVRNGYKETVQTYYPAIVRQKILDSTGSVKRNRSELVKQFEDAKKHYKPVSVDNGESDNFFGGLAEDMFGDRYNNPRDEKATVITYLQDKGLSTADIIKMFGGVKDSAYTAKEFLTFKYNLSVATNGREIGNADGMVVTTYNL